MHTRHPVRLQINRSCCRCAIKDCDDDGDDGDCVCVLAANAHGADDTDAGDAVYDYGDVDVVVDADYNGGIDGADYDGGADNEDAGADVDDDDDDAQAFL